MPSATTSSSRLRASVITAVSAASMRSNSRAWLGSPVSGSLHACSCSCSEVRRRASVRPRRSSRAPGSAGCPPEAQGAGVGRYWRRSPFRRAGRPGRWGGWREHRARRRSGRPPAAGTAAGSPSRGRWVAAWNGPSSWCPSRLRLCPTAQVAAKQVNTRHDSRCRPVRRRDAAQQNPAATAGESRLPTSSTTTASRLPVSRTRTPSQPRTLTIPAHRQRVSPTSHPSAATRRQ